MKPRQGVWAGVRASPLSENMSLVIRPNLHRNSEGGVKYRRNCFGDSTVQKSLKF